MIRTRIIVERNNDGVVDRKVYPVGTDNPKGLHGVAAITIQVGQEV